MKLKMNHLDLFSGIGGFALAAKRTWGNDLNIVGFCEIEEYAQKVLQKNFPGIKIPRKIAPGDLVSSQGYMSNILENKTNFKDISKII